MEGQRRNIGSLDWLSPIQPISSHRRGAGNGRGSMLWLQTRTAGRQHIYPTLMIYLLTFCSTGCRLGHMPPVEELTAVYRARSPISRSSTAHKPRQKCVCVRWLHPLSPPCERVADTLKLTYRVEAEESSAPTCSCSLRLSFLLYLILQHFNWITEYLFLEKFACLTLLCLKPIKTSPCHYKTKGFCLMSLLCLLYSAAFFPSFYCFL